VNDTLRIGVLVDGPEVPAWAFRMLEKVRENGDAEIVLIVQNTPECRPPRSFLTKLREHSRQLGSLLLEKLERRLFRLKPDAFDRKDLRELLPDVPIRSVEPLRSRFSDTFPDDALADIRSRNIDVLVRLGFRILRGEILKAARYGVWSFHHGDNRVNRGGPAGAWEVLLNWATTGSVLQVLTEDLDGGQVLFRSQSKTDHLSIRRNRNAMYWKTLSFLPRALRQLRRLGPAVFFEQVDRRNSAPALYSQRLFTTPTNRELLTLLPRHAARWIGLKLRSLLFVDQWFLLFAFSKQPGFSSSIWRFRRIIPPKDRFYADPFVVYREGVYHVFMEELRSENNRGFISCCQISEDGSVTEPTPVLQRPYHLSYPFVFQVGQETCMIPETSEIGAIELYRCIEFPLKWEKHSDVMRGVSAVDATLHEEAGRWWLFTNIRENEGASSLDELFLFHSSDPLAGQWTPHPMNPIVSDVASARPAGRIFRHNGKLYRPSQDCSQGYGYGVRINEIVTLTDEDYEERQVTGIEPHWSPDVRAVHTFNFEERLTVIDSVRRRFRFGRS
jgi:hypothetical protein